MPSGRKPRAQTTRSSGPSGGAARPVTPSIQNDEQAQLAALARVSLYAYADFVHGYRGARHHEVWMDVLEREIERETDEVRFLVFDAPPGHAKSSYLSEALPTWFLGRYPEESVLHYTSTDNLAGVYHAIVESTLRGDTGDPDSRAARHALVFPEPACRPGDLWNFEKGLRLAGAKEKVSYKMAGYGSAVLGLRGKLNILDDPLTEDKAESETELAKAKRYLRRTVWTRKKPGAIFVLVATRWGYDDLTAYVLKSFPGVQLIHMPALGHWLPDGTRVGDVEHGEALWPEYISRAQLIQELHGAEGDDGMSLDDFLTIFQGEPGNAEGGQLKPDFVKQVPDLHLRDKRDGSPLIQVTNRAQSWDLAFTKKTRSDYSVCATGVSDGHNIYLTDLFVGRISEAQFETELQKQAQLHQPFRIGIEAVSAAKWVAQGVDRRTILPIEPIDVGNATKEARANLLALLIEKGRFFADKKAPYWLRVAQQMREFPKGRHDDIVDAIAQLCHLLKGGGGVQVVRTTETLRVGRADVMQHETLKQRMARKQRARLGAAHWG